MKTILIVDDCPDTLDLYSMVLMSKNHIILTALSVQQAVEIAYTKRIDLLVTDLFLGDGLGTELLHLLGKRLPKSVILVTGRDPYPAKRYQGFDDYLIKPVDCDLLVKTVQNCLDLQRDVA